MPNKILIVDDDAEIRKVISIYLENEGFETYKAENGQEALKMIEENKVDLVLLDIMMPGMNGLEVCMKIRENNVMPIIFLSAKSEDMDKIQGLTSGADDYITKPFSALEKKELRIINNVPDNNMNVKMDIENVVRVFENILNNAEKYSYKPSDIVVNVEKEEGHVIISFSNRGEHIPQEKIDKMFERFYRIDPSRSNNVPGSGLGLAISKKIIELHSGHIWAESNGDIITFKVKLQSNE